MDPRLFYEIMTAHGIGMVGTAGLTGLAVLWTFLGRHVDLDERVFWVVMALCLSGVVVILRSIFVGGFAGAWTFLYSLHARSGKVRSPVSHSQCHPRACAATPGSPSSSGLRSAGHLHELPHPLRDPSCPLRAHP